jgi:tetratricopeptide (TPR) repeat protein
MGTRRAGGFVVSLCLGLAVAIALATNSYLAYRITYPPRLLRVSIVYDAANPPHAGILPGQLKSAVESLSPFFEKEAGIRVTASAIVPVHLPPQTFDPVALWRYLNTHMAHYDADVIIAFWPPPPGNTSLGSALPLASAAVVRLVPGDQKINQAVLAHQLLTVFGVPDSKDPQSVMFSSPKTMKLDRASAAYLRELRLFDFAHGLGGMSGRMALRVLACLERQSAGTSKSGRQLLAQLYLRDALFSSAAEQFRLVLRSDPGNLEAHLGFSSALAQSDQLKAAEVEARTAIRLAPNQAEPYYRLAYALLRDGGPDAAIPEFQRAIELDPQSIRNRTGLAVAYAWSVSHFEEAEKEFQVALKIDPNNSALLSAIDSVNNFRNRLKKQLDVVEANARTHPLDSNAHDSLASALLRLGQVQRSSAEAREAIQLKPLNWRPHYTLALALYASHDYAGSRTALAEAQKLGSGARPYLDEALQKSGAR